MQLPKPCLVCGVVTPNSRCPEHRRLQRSLWSDRTALRRRSRIQGVGGAARRLRYKINRANAPVVCAFCRSDFNPAFVHIDHIMPIASGGSDMEDNIRILCIPCHKSRPYPKPAHP